MSAIMDFLLENDTSGIVSEVTISKRIPHKFKIRPMTPKEKNSWRKRCQSAIKGKGEVSFDSGKFTELTCINCTLEPSFNSADNIAKAGVVTPEDLLYKVLLAGEVDELHEQICKLSGFDTEGNDDVTQEDIDKAKN